jgi:hypothetical protein
MMSNNRKPRRMIKIDTRTGRVPIDPAEKVYEEYYDEKEKKYYVIMGKGEKAFFSYQTKKEAAEKMKDLEQHGYKKTSKQ